MTQTPCAVSHFPLLYLGPAHGQRGAFWRGGTPGQGSGPAWCEPEPSCLWVSGIQFLCALGSGERGDCQPPCQVPIFWSVRNCSVGGPSTSAEKRARCQVGPGAHGWATRMWDSDTQIWSGQSHAWTAGPAVQAVPSLAAAACLWSC